MNFENKQFKMGRFCERICTMRGDFTEVMEWIDFVNNISREFDIQLNEKILLASIKLNYNKILIVKVVRKNYYLVGKWNKNIEGRIEINLEKGGILYLENDKIKLLKEDKMIDVILRKLEDE